jgi:hypothetical protein
MEKLSPRSYVTGGFDILKPVLINHVGKILQSSGKAWWHDCIYSKFGSDNNIPRAGNIGAMHEFLDEHLLFKVCRYNKNILSSKLSNVEFELIEKLFTIRNAWAHTPGIGMTENDADNSFSVMIELMEAIDFHTIERLLSIREQMHKYYFMEKPVKASREHLIAFLDDKVLAPAINGKNCSEEIKRKIEHTRELLDKTNTAEEVSNFFWYNIITSLRGYDSYRKLREFGFTTFEDAREEFNLLCYGE